MTLTMECSLCRTPTPHDTLTTVTLRRPGADLVIRKLCEACALDFTAAWYGVARVTA